jgi:hypothetical protein
MNKDLPGLRFPFDASAEVFIENSTARLPARVTELSLRGCRIETSGTLVERQSIQIKLFNSGEYFEAPGTVIYVKPSGVGLLFGDMKPQLQAVLQKWILAALDKQAE